MHSFILVFVCLLQEALPYKATDEFTVTLDYQFKTKPAPDHQTVDLGETVAEAQKRKSRISTPLPYLILNVELLKLPAGEKRVKVYTNDSKVVLNKKIEELQVIPLDLGFTDNVKDRVSPYEYTMIFLNADKKEINRIVIYVDESGDFLVNNEKRGRL